MNYYKYVPQKLITTVFFSLSAVILASCGSSTDRIKERETMLATPSPTPGERAIAGSFAVSGTDSGGLNPYSGSLTVAPKGDNYEFRWGTTRGTRVGTGVQMGSSTAATFAATGGGKGCGVGLYRIAPGGTLDGRIASWGETNFAIEKAVRTEGTGFVGKYSVTGTTADGKPYSGSLQIKKDGSGYDFNWKLDKPSVGFAIWKGSIAAVSFGGPQCGFALYDIQSNGSLEGDWGGQKQVTFGKETARRQ